MLVMICCDIILNAVSRLTTCFNSYLDDEVATKTAIDEEGFYRTGDLAHRVGDEYIFDGRASTDCESNMVNITFGYI